MNRITKGSNVFKGKEQSRFITYNSWLKLTGVVICHIALFQISKAQNVGVNTAGSQADPSTILDLNTGNNFTTPKGKGLLIPNVALTSATDKTTIQTPAAYLMVFVPQSATGLGVSPGYYYNAGSSVTPNWIQLGIVNNNDWCITGNGGTTAGTNFVGTTDHNDLVFKTNGAENMRITQTNGYVGINTSAPFNQLDVKGNEAVGTYAGTSAGPANGLIVSGQVGIGTPTPSAGSALEVASTTQGMLIPRSTSAPSPTSTSLLYYDLTLHCFMFYNSSGSWQPVVCACNGVPSTPVISSGSGSNTFCSGSTGSYSTTTPTNGALFYTWTVPAGTTITSGQGTASINVTYGSTSGYVTCTATNSCGTSSTASYSIFQEVSVPITITNNQTSAIGSNFAQQITFNSSAYSQYEMSGLQNVEFSTSPAAVGPLYAWIESGASSSSTNTVYWVNLAGLTLGANGGSQTIYINFMPTAIMGNATSQTGEAPEISSANGLAYGVYDNGAEVFTFYDGFISGTAKWNNYAYSAVNGTLTVNNGLTITSSGLNWTNNILYTPTAYGPNIVAETYAEGNSPQSASRSYMPGLISAAPTTQWTIEDGETSDIGGGPPASFSYVAFGNGRNALVEYSWLQGTPTSPNPYHDYNEYQTNPTSGQYYIFGVYYTGSNNSLYINYGIACTGNSSYSPSGALYLALGVADESNSGTATATSMSAYWARVRTAPPNNVMPGTLTGSIQCP